MLYTRGNGADTTAQPIHFYRDRGIDDCAVAQLASRVSSPALDPANRGQGAGVGSSRGNSADPAAQPTHVYRGRAVVDRSSIPQLTGSITSPTLDPAA